jgi:hypothetical protein
MGRWLASSQGGLAQRVRAKRGPVTGSGVNPPFVVDDGGMRFAHPPWSLAQSGRSQLQNSPQNEKPGAKAGLIANNF